MKPVEIVHSGNDYFERLYGIISNAKKEIHLQTYIFDYDDTGRVIGKALKEAALRKVKVYVVLDGYGASSLPKDFISDLMKAGVQFRYFSPMFSLNSLYIGRRLHHKVAVADGTTAIVGGINIADKYRGSEKEFPWLDYAIQVNSQVASSLEIFCRNIFLKKKRFRKIKTPWQFQYPTGEIVRILRNDWLKRKSEISRTYLQTLRKAKDEVIIVGSYFFPGKKFLRTLKNASGKKGVKVKLILSKNQDVPIVRRATRHLYHSLLSNKVEIYEWKRSVLHGKAAVADKEWATIGSFNLNHLSSYGSLELNIEVVSKDFAQSFTAELESVISQCERISQESLLLRHGWFSRFLDLICYYLLRLLSIIVTYLPYKRAFKSFANEE